MSYVAFTAFYATYMSHIACVIVWLCKPLQVSVEFGPREVWRPSFAVETTLMSISVVSLENKVV